MSKLRVSSQQVEKEWHTYYCDCKGSMKGKNILGTSIQCPAIPYQDFKRRATDGVYETLIDFLEKLGVEIENSHS